jgi:hypothetical protein
MLKLSTRLAARRTLLRFTTRSTERSGTLVPSARGLSYDKRLRSLQVGHKSCHCWHPLERTSTVVVTAFELHANDTCRGSGASGYFLPASVSRSHQFAGRVGTGKPWDKADGLLRPAGRDYSSASPSHRTSSITSIRRHTIATLAAWLEHSSTDKSRGVGARSQPSKKQLGCWRT